MTELFQLEKLAKKYGFTVIVDADEEENPEYYVTFINSPSSFSKVFGRVADVQTSMLNFLVSSGSLQPDADEEELCSLSLLDIVAIYSSAKHRYEVQKNVGGTCILYNGTRNNFPSHADARNFLVSLVTKHLAEDKTEMITNSVMEDKAESYVLNEMQETAKDLHAAGVMDKETMEKLQEPAQDTKEAWWNGARAALGLPFDTPRSVVSASFLSKSKTTLADLLNVIHESVELSSANELKEAVKLIVEVQAMNSGMRDCIRAAYLNGPIDDGDVPSKSGRDALLTSGYISKVVVRGEQGFNACTYKGASAYKLIEAGA